MPNTLKSLFFCLSIFSFLSFAFVASAAEVCDPKTIDVVLRDDEGDFIPNMNFEIFRQETDVDGRPKPAKLIRAGKIDEYLGRGSVTFSDSDGSDYAIRAYDQEKEVGSFWFFDDASVGCGETVEVNEYLSSINVVLRNTEGELIRDKEFNLYTQRYDADNNPIKETDDLVGELDTSSEGEARLYVPGSMDSVDGMGTDYYVLEVVGDDGGIYKEYDIRVSSADETQVNYILSDLKINLKDENGILFPAGEKISIYKQTEDADGEKILGAFVKDIYTNDKGEAFLEYPEDIYVARIIGADNKSIDFFDLEVEKEDRREYTLETSGEWSGSAGACSDTSVLTVRTKTIDNEVLGSLFFSLYEQTLDASNMPAAGELIYSARMDETGIITKDFNPDPRKKYALHFYQSNKTFGSIWVYDEVQFVCGQDFEIEKKFPAINIILRNGDGDLVKNRKFSLFTQKIDVDGFSVREKKDLVGSNFLTTAEGKAVIYVSPDKEEIKERKKMYVLEVLSDNKKVFNEYDIAVSPNQDTIVDYTFSDVVLELLYGNGQAIKEKAISIYKRETGASGDYILGKLELTSETNGDGKVQFVLPEGYYSVKINDSLNKNSEMHSIRIANRERRYKTLKFNLTRLSVRDATGNYKTKAGIKVYELNKNENGKYIRGNLAGTINTGDKGISDYIFAPGPYLFVYIFEKKEYARALYVENSKMQELYIQTIPANIVEPSYQFSLAEPVVPETLADRMKGRILLQVEGNGEAWYVDHNTKKRYYMKDGATAYNMMRDFGLGISNADLKKIPIGLDERFAEYDYDGDYVSDKMEEAIGTDMYDYDSDDDSYSDGEEIKNGFDPSGPGSLNIDQALADKLRGKILLQVESRGEAWYIHPEDGKRYYMKDGDSAYEIMRFLSLGITDENLEEIEIGKMN